jgi:hypothetical protein
MRMAKLGLDVHAKEYKFLMHAFLGQGKSYGLTQCDTAVDEILEVAKSLVDN